MKLIKLINARNVIVQFVRERMSVQTAYKLFCFLRSTDKDELFYSEKRKGIIDRYAKKDEGGNYVQEGNGIALISNTAEICKQEITELENTEIELSAMFSITELSGLSLSMKDIFDLEELLIEEGVND